MLDKLKALNVRYNILGLPVFEETNVARALVVALIEFARFLTAEKRIMETSHSTLTLDEVRSSMDTLHSTNYSEPAKAENKQSESEVRLSNISSGRGGQGRGRGKGRGIGSGRGSFTCVKL
jgi:hypothetical protein